MKPYFPAVRVDDRCTDRETKAEALGLGGGKRSEQAAGQFALDAGSVVRDADLYSARRVEPHRRDPDPPVRLVRSCDSLDGIAHEVEDHLLQLDAVAVDRR